jgi:hypothetical protein
MNLNLMQELWAQWKIAYKQSLMENGHVFLADDIHNLVAQGL